MSDAYELESPVATPPAAISDDGNDNIDVDRLISAVAKRPQIWNKLSPLYVDRNLKIKSWDEISDEIVDDWSKLSNKQKKAIGEYFLFIIINIFWHYFIKSYYGDSDRTLATPLEINNLHNEQGQ